MRRCRKTVSDVEVTLDGRLFHTHEAATGNARSPMVGWHVDGTTKAKDVEAGGHGSGNVRPHGGVDVQVDPEITDRGCGLNKVRAYSNLCTWDLMLTSAGRTPEDLGFTGIQLELVTIRIHNAIDLVNTRMVGRVTVAQLAERRSLVGELTLSCARPADDG